MATLVWTATVSFSLSLFERPAAVPVPEAAGEQPARSAADPILAT
jgi:hypothetical protein